MSSRVVKRAYRYRFHPAPQQADLLNRTFGCVRYAYNRALAERSRAWTREQKRVSFAETCQMLTGRPPSFRAGRSQETIMTAPVDHVRPRSETRGR